jgi:site-specific DNA-methyltransferase (adenine-specific)
MIRKRDRFMKFSLKSKGEMYLGDCLEKLKSFEDSSFDHCITDPPYNISGYDDKKNIGWYSSNPTWKKEKSFKKIEEDWDSFSDQEYLIFTRDWIKEIKRVVKPNGNIFIFGTYHNIYKVGFILEALDTRIINSIIWYKRNAFPNITQRMFCESTEQIIWAVNNSKKKAKNWTFNYKELKEMTVNKKQMRNMWDIPMTSVKEKKFGKHPSQKPMEIADRLILGCTNVGDTILDPFFGSGTFLLSALNHNRKFVGIDNNYDYFKLAQERLNKR